MTTGTPTKLRSGEWGARIQGTHRKGSTVTATITTRAGKSWTGNYRVIWSGNGISLAAKVNGQSRHRRPTRQEMADMAEDMGHFSHLNPGRAR